MEKTLPRFKQMGNMIWLTFQKDYFGCCVESRLWEGRVEAGRPLGDYHSHQAADGSGLDQDGDSGGA